MVKLLSDKLVNVKPRETSGSRSSNRFDFQKDWAICELLRLHLSGEDYLLILDYHEDIVVLDSESFPGYAKFYQIKSKNNGNWTIQQLCKSDPKKKTDSILKKLFTNYLLYPDETTNLVFISNRGVNVSLKDGSSGLDHFLIAFTDFTDIDKEKIHISTEGDHAEKSEFLGLNMLSMKLTELGVIGHDIYAKGKLVDFFAAVSPRKGIDIDLVYKTLFDEVKRKNDAEGVFSNFNELKNRKGIGRTTFSEMVKAFTNHSSNSKLWNEANSMLTAEGYKYSVIRSIRTSWNKYTIEVINASDDDLQYIRQVIRCEIRNFEQGNQIYDLKDLIAYVKPVVDFKKVPSLHGEAFIEEAAILYEAMSYDSVQEIDKKLEEEAA